MLFNVLNNLDFYKFKYLSSIRVMMEYFKALSKFNENCSLMNISESCGKLFSGSLKSFFTGTDINRCRRIYPNVYVA